MTNATVEDVSGDLLASADANGSFTVSFPGGGDQVKLAEGVRISQFEAADASDLVPGVSISASVNNGTAQFVTINQG